MSSQSRGGTEQSHSAHWCVFELQALIPACLSFHIQTGHCKELGLMVGIAFTLKNSDCEAVLTSALLF